MSDQVEKAQLLNRAVRILECFTQDRPELGVREVSRLVAVPHLGTGLSFSQPIIGSVLIRLGLIGALFLGIALNQR